MERALPHTSSPPLPTLPSHEPHHSLVTAAAPEAAASTPMSSPATPMHEELQEARSPFSTPCSTRIASPQAGLTFADPYDTNNNNNNMSNNEAAEDELVRRLRRENRMLRCQLLRTQREQGSADDRAQGNSPAPHAFANRALSSAAELDVSSTADNSAHPSSSRAQSALCLSEMRGASQQEIERPLTAVPAQGTPLAAAAAEEVDAEVVQSRAEENEALWLRLQTLQRQAERERARRLATERELRQEIERLRLALELAEEARAQAVAAMTAATAVASPSDAHARVVSFPATTASGLDVGGEYEENEEGEGKGEMYDANTLHVASDTQLSKDAGQQTSPHSNHADHLAVHAAHARYHSHHSRVASYFSTSPPPTPELIVADEAVADLTTSPAAVSANTPYMDRNMSDYTTLAEDFVYAKRGDGAALAAFERPLADALHRESADRRERRRLRLQQLVPAETSAQVALRATPLVSEDGEAMQTRQTSQVIATTTTTTATAGGSSQAELAGGSAGNAHDALVDHRGGGHATVASPLLAQAAHNTLVNPNQIGIEIREAEHNRTWYLRRVLGLTFLHMVAPTRRRPHEANATQPTSMNASQVQLEAAGTSRQASATLAQQESSSNNISAAAAAGVHDGQHGSPSSSSSSSSSSIASPAASRTAGTLLADGDIAPILPSSAFAHVTSGSITSTPAKATPLVYKEISPIALQRAIKELVVLHFRCIGNEPQLVTDSRRRNNNNNNSNGSRVVGSAPAFEEENSDVQLRAAFVPTASQLSGSDVYVGNDERYASPVVLGNAHGGHHNLPNNNNNNNTTTTSNSGTSNNGYREDEVRVSFHAPVIFGQIRDYLRLDADAFRTAAATAVWRQSLSPGKSGTTLYFFGDYILKSLRESEFAFLCNKYLPAYVQYCERNPHTMLARFYAVLTVEWLQLGTRRRYVLMQNVFKTRYYIHRIYDVKGSRVGRTARRADGSYPRNAYGALLLKDNDLPPQLILCGAYQRAIVLAQFRSDVYFLHALGIVDYSCMIGVRSRICSSTSSQQQQQQQEQQQQRGHVGSHGLDMTDSHAANARAVDAANAAHTTAVRKTTQQQLQQHADEVDCEEPCEGASDEDGSACIHGCDGGLLSLPLYTGGEDTTTAREDVYYLGIIDVLQEYNSVKKLESFAKGLVNDRRDISVVPPKDYADRLIHLLERIIV